MSPIRLRGHHFICLQFFRGSGYDRAFVTNLSSVVANATRVPAEVVAGPDDVCRACPWTCEGVCISPSAGGEETISELDARALALLDLEPGDHMALREVSRRLRANPSQAAEWRDASCRGCTWESACMADWPKVLGPGA